MSKSQVRFLERPRHSVAFLTRELKASLLPDVRRDVKKLPLRPKPPKPSIRAPHDVLLLELHEKRRRDIRAVVEYELKKVDRDVEKELKRLNELVHSGKIDYASMDKPKVYSEKRKFHYKPAERDAPYFDSFAEIQR